jgi:hypothetical protein
LLTATVRLVTMAIPFAQDRPVSPQPAALTFALDEIRAGDPVAQPSAP